MCLLDYSKKKRKYKHINQIERTMIETWYNCDKKSKKEIAELLHKSERTIRREINRGLVIVKNYDWTGKEEYSAKVAQEKYEYGMTSKGPELKLDQDINLVKHIEKEIIENNKSPEVVSKQLKDFELLKKLKESKKYVLIEQSDDIDNLPIKISEEEIKLNLENFLITVFMLNGDFKKENLPIFLEEMKEERHICITMALEYLRIFVYKLLM